MNELRYTSLVPDLWSALQKETRKGWVHAGIENPETVAEHTVDLMRIGNEVAAEANLSEQERTDLCDMLEVHDWPEGIVGDEITQYGVDVAKEAEAKAVKFAKERAAMERICAPLGTEGERILALWLRFETSHDTVAVLARELDKYQAIEKAFACERAGGPAGLGEEFVKYSPPMTHPALVARVANLRSA